MVQFNKPNRRLVIIFAFLFFAGNIISAQCIAPSVGCSGADRNNAFLTSSDPNTIEYDNVVSTFHSTLARQANGDVLVWGERTAADDIGSILTPHLVNSVNYPSLTGEILKFAGGSSNINFGQRVVLTIKGYSKIIKATKE